MNNGGYYPVKLKYKEGKFESCHIYVDWPQVCMVNLIHILRDFSNIIDVFDSSKSHYFTIIKKYFFFFLFYVGGVSLYMTLVSIYVFL